MKAITIDELIYEITINGLAKLNFSEISIYLLENNTQNLVQKSLIKNGEYVVDFLPKNVIVGNDLIGLTAENMTAKIINSTPKSNIPISEIAVPIVYAHKLLGVIYCKQLSYEFFESKHISILNTIATICAVKIDKILSEITKKQLSLELLEQLKLNKQSQLNSLFQVTIDAVVVIDENLKIINWNNIAEKTFGWNALEVIGKYLPETIFKETNIQKSNFLIYIKSYEQNPPNKLFEFTAINKENQEIEISMGISQTSYINNKIFIVYFRDITERKKAEESLKKSKENAEIASKSKTDFLANMSHEIRTPMNAIIGFSELLYNSIQDEKQKSQVNTIRLAAKNLLTIINDILDLSKIESGKMELQLEKVNLYNLVQEIEIILNPSFMEKGLKFYKQLESIQKYLLLIDSLRLKQILINLVSNAVKFTETGYIKISIEEISKINNDKVDLLFSVQDTGIGIPEDQLELIFEQFSQKKGQDIKSYGGTGLGLAISKKLVELMGGELNVSSRLGLGSTFSFYVPNIQIIELSDELETVNDYSFSITKFKNAKILIADDLETNRELIKDIFLNSPIEFYETSNGQEAIEIAKLVEPDLIFMDLRMPIINGFEATKILKSNKQTKHIPVIAISASAFMVLNKKNEINIFDEYITKPIDVNLFIEVVKKYLKVNINEKNTISKNENTDGILISNSNNIETMNKDEVNEIILHFENKFQPLISNAINNQMIDEIEKIGNDLILYGKKISIDLIVDYGKKIIIFANNFEVNKLIDILKKFPELLNNLKENQDKNEQN